MKRLLLTGLLLLLGTSVFSATIGDVKLVATDTPTTLSMITVTHTPTEVHAVKTVIVVKSTPTSTPTINLTPTVVPLSAKLGTKTVRIEGKFPMVSMGDYSVADTGDALAGLIYSADYLYNVSKSYVIIILDVPVANATAVNTILNAKASAVDSSKSATIEQEFKGYVNHLTVKSVE